MTSIEPQTAPPKPKRRWYQYSLRTLLVFVLVWSIACSWFAVKMFALLTNAHGGAF